MTEKKRFDSRPQRERKVVTRDQRLRFDLRRVAGGVLVSRRHASDFQDVEHAVVFSESMQFHHYLDLDDLRFTYVLQYVELKRAFDELLAVDF